MAALSETLVLINRVSGPAKAARSDVEKLNRSVDKVKGNLSKAARSQDQLSKSTQRATKDFKKFQADDAAGNLLGGGASAQGILFAGAAMLALGAFAAKAAKAVAELAFNFGEGVVKAHLARGEAEALMNTLSGGRGAEVLSRLKTQSIALGQSFSELVLLTKKSRDAGLDFKDAFKLNATRADLIAMGRTAEEADTAIGNMLEEVKKGTKSSSAGIEELRKKFGIMGPAGEAAAKKASSGLGGLVTRLKNAPANIFDAIAQRAGPKLDQLGTKMIKLIDEFINSGEAAKFIDKIVAGVEKVVQVIGIAAQLVAPFWQGFKAALAPVISQLEIVSNAIGKAFGGDKQTAMQNLMTIARGLGVAIGFLLGQALQMAAGFAAVIAAGAALFGWLTSLATKAYEAGSALITGLAGGIRNGIGIAVAAVQELVNRVKSTFTAGLKLGSPSRLFEDYGKFTGEGFVRGVEGKQAAAANATMGLGAAQPRAGARGAGAGGDVNVTIQVTAGAGATKSEGEAFGSGIAAALRRDWPALFELKLLEAGV